LTLRLAIQPFSISPKRNKSLVERSSGWGQAAFEQ
jgi:hypothetical protein